MTAVAVAVKYADMLCRTINGITFGILTGQKQEHGTVASVAPIEIDGFTAPGHKIKNVLLSDCVLPPNAKLLLSRYDALTISNLHTEEAQATSRYSATL